MNTSKLNAQAPTFFPGRLCHPKAPFRNRGGLSGDGKLKVLLINIRSLRNKIKVNDLAQLTRQHCPDVVCVNETWLDSTITDGEITLAGYNILLADR